MVDLLQMLSLNLYGELCGLAKLGKGAEQCFTVFVRFACLGA
jgi:hypothetical protein